MTEAHNIGTLRESSLHAALKRWYARPGDRLEVEVDGYMIDIVRETHLVEIQTGNFSNIKAKLADLLERHTVRLVYPIARRKWIRRVTADDRTVARRKSPKKGRVEDLFGELVRLPELVKQPHLELSVLFIEMEEIWRDDGRGSWRRKGWSIADRRLLEVLDEHRFDQPADFLTLLPAELPEQFTTADLAAGLRMPRRTAQRMSYSFRHMGIIEQVGKQGRAYLYRTSAPFE